MTVLFILLILVASVILSLIVLIQEPKGGGLSGTFGGFSNQFMGVKQTTDVLEKGTWIFAAAIAILCIVSTMFISGGNVVNRDRLQNVSSGPVPTQQTAPATNPNNAPLTAPITPNQTVPTQQQPTK